MDKQTSEMTIERLTETSECDITALQHLLSQLSNRFRDHVISREIIAEIIASDHHDILVARNTTNDVIIGCATLSVTFGTGAGKRAWLDDFVIDSQYQGAGIGSQLWDEIISWVQRHNATALQFTSSDKHKAAHEFYLKRGANIRDTNFFKKAIAR